MCIVPVTKKKERDKEPDERAGHGAVIMICSAPLNSVRYIASTR